MFRPLLVSLLLASALGSPARAEPDEVNFRDACLIAGGAEDVCTCKATAAGRLLDGRMLRLVVQSMRDPAGFTAMSQKGGLSHADNMAWTAYIRESNRACNLSY